MNVTSTKVGRRSFLKKLVLVGAASEVMLNLKGNNTGNKTTQMLTPDGLLVSIDESIIKREITAGRATNREVLEWMQNGANKSR